VPQRDTVNHEPEVPHEQVDTETLHSVLHVVVLIICIFTGITDAHNNAQYQPALYQCHIVCSGGDGSGFLLKRPRASIVVMAAAIFDLLISLLSVLIGGMLRDDAVGDDVSAFALMIPAQIPCSAFANIP
jgi:hypothetical protein